MNHTQIVRYSIGFFVSVALTLAAYVLVTGSNVGGSLLLGSIAVLAIIQLIVQLVCFLHLGEEDKPRWRLRAFVAITGALLLIVFGSIWIMNNLDYHMTSEHETNSHMIEESNKGF